MRRLSWLFVCVLVAAVPAVGFGEKPLRPPPAFGPIAPPPPPPQTNYKAPKADGPVVELLDEGVDALGPVLINDGGGETGTFAREDRDAFAGVEAVRVTPMQKYRSVIPGWNFKIVETPKNAGEYRYLRFAWKKLGGSGLMIQLHDPVKTWAFRYHAGRNVYNWVPSTQVSDAPPAEWQVVTRDLFKDYGSFTISGFALSPLDGTAALFDHMLLGRSVEDLDKATDAALGRVKPAGPLGGKERDALWADLMGADRVKAAAAQRAFLASATGQVGFIAEQLGKTAPDRDRVARIQRLVKDLDADAFDVRDRATDELVKIGPDATDAVRALLSASPNDEVAYRARLVLRKLGADGSPVGEAGRTMRAVRVLERAGNADARALLGKLAAGEFGFGIVPDAKAALARLEKKK